MCLWLYNKLRINSSVLCLFLIGTLAFITNKLGNVLFPQTGKLVDLSACLACYGTSACDQIFDGNIKIQPFDIYSALSHVFTKKNIFYGFANETTQIVLKKLAHQEELEAFDKLLCENSEFDLMCRNKNENKNDFNEKDYLNSIIDNNNNIYNQLVNKLNFIDKIKTAVSPNHYMEEDGSGLILCPTAFHLDKILNKLDSNNINIINLWTLIKINPEPIILQILRADEGWPVAKYYGACGRTVLEEYAGPPMTIYYNEPWLRRAKIVINLLEAARMFTFRDHDFSFYLTDLSPDNIAIDQNDTPKFVDLENIIVLNRNIPMNEIPDKWHQLHVSETIVDCEECFTFSPSDLCSHHISDHNYYAICQIITSFKPMPSSSSKGFLHSIPEDIKKTFSDLNVLLKECVTPIKEKSRISVGDELKEVLKKIVDNYSETK